MKEFSAHPVGFIEFFLRYVGGPFIALIGFKQDAIVIGEFAAAVLVLHREMQYQREFAALALELQIDDADRILALYPWPQLGLDIAYKARQQHLSIFGIPPFRGANLLLDQKIETGFTRA